VTEIGLFDGRGDPVKGATVGVGVHAANIETNARVKYFFIISGMTNPDEASYKESAYL
jgi:hypothetical protein